MKLIASKQLKIISLIVCAFTCILLTSCGFISRKAVNNVTDSNTKDTEKPMESDEKELLQLSGTVADASANTITVLSSDGNTYTFNNSANNFLPESYVTIIGFPIIVYYYGSLDETLEIQKVQIEKITVDDSKDLTVRARQILDTMSIEEKIGQMFIVRCPKENSVQAVSKYHLGGYILFAPDFKGKTKSEVSSDIQGYQAASKIGMLIGVDEEGGSVNRVSLYKQFRAVPFWSSQRLVCAGRMEFDYQ